MLYVSFLLSTSILHETYTSTEIAFEILNLKSYLYFQKDQEGGRLCLVWGREKKVVEEGCQEPWNQDLHACAYFRNI